MESIVTNGFQRYGPPSVQNYNFENGRRYHAFREGSYLMPNDEREQDRLDFAHEIFRLLLRNGLTRAPMDPPPRRVLDLGTGTGAWAIDFASEYPDSEVIGVDLSPIQPRYAPPNCSFFVDDIESPWLFGPPFDFIHSRGLVGSIEDWDTLLGQIYDNLVDGGLVEFQEYELKYGADDDTLSRTPAISLWQDKLIEAHESINRPVNIARTIRQRLQDRGFVDLHEEVAKVPVGPWPKNNRQKQIGILMLQHSFDALEALTLAPFSRVLRWSRDEMHDLMDRVRLELANGSNHLYVTVHYVWGRKPASNQPSSERPVSNGMDLGL